MKPQLIFVYNAEGGAFSKIIDAAHKIISPKTYSCELCSITYGNFGINKKWKAYIKSLPYDKVFYYKNEWEQLHLNVKAELPVILFWQNEDDKPEVLISKKEIQLQDLTSLIEQMKEKLKKK